MNLNDMRYFALVVGHNGYAAAERASGVSKSKLSRRIADLERTLGLRLLQRNTRNLELTAAGEDFYIHCRSIVEEAEAAGEMIMRLKSEPSGTIRLSCPSSVNHFYLADIMPEFMKRHPKVKVTLLVTNNPVRIINERIDIAILTGLSLGSSRQDFVVKKLAESRMILLASPAYLEKYGAPARLEDLAGQATIGSVDDKLEGTAVWELTGPDGASSRVAHNPRFRTHDTISQLNVLVQGLGIGLAPETPAALDIRRGRLVRVLEDYQGKASPIMMAFLSRRGLLPAVRVLIDYLAEQVPLAVNQYLQEEKDGTAG